MAITVVKEPGVLSFSKNPVFYELQSDARLTNLGSQAVNRIFFDGAVASGAVVSIRYNGREIRMLASNVLTPGWEFPSGDGSAAWVQSLVPYFEDNFYLSTDFEIEYQLYGGTPSLIFTARENGSDYNFIGQVNNGIAVQVLTQGAAPVVKPNFSIYVELYIENATHDGFEQIFAEPLPTDESGTVQWNISELLHPQLLPDQPTWAGMSLKKDLLSERQYYIRYAEAWGENFQIGKATTAATRHVILGGTPYKDGSTATVLGKVRENADPDRDRALRYGADTRYVFPDEPQYLTFLNTRGAVEAGLWSLKVSIAYYDTANIDTFYVAPASQAVDLYEKMTFAVGFAQLNLQTNGNPAYVIKSYAVQLFDVSTAISREYTYVLDYAEQPYRRYFAYQNSLGAFDVVKTWGRLSAQLELVRKSASRYLSPDYQLPDGSYIDWNITARQRFDAATGYRTLREIVNLRDFYLSRYKYRVSPVGKAYPVSIVTTSVKEGKDGENLYAHIFEYTYQYDDDTYSEDTDVSAAETYAPPPGFQSATGDPILINIPPPPGFDQAGAPLFDDTPTEGSQNIPRSAGVFSRLAAKQDLLSLGLTTQYRRGDHTLGNFQLDVEAIAQNKINQHQDTLPEYLTEAELTDREPDFSDIPALNFVPDVRSTQLVDIGQYLTTNHNPAQLSVKLLSKSARVSAVQLSGLQASITAQPEAETEGYVLLEIKDTQKGFSKTVSVPITSNPIQEVAFDLYNAVSGQGISAIPADNSGIYPLLDRWDIKFLINQLHDGVYYRIWGGGPDGTALDFENADPFEAVNPVINATYSAFGFSGGAVSPAGLYNVEFRAYLNGNEVYARTSSFSFVADTETPGSTVFEFWDESGAGQKLADMPNDNSYSLIAPTNWDIHMLVSDTPHNGVYANLKDASNNILHEWGTPYENVTQTSDASYQLFGPGGSGSGYGPGTYTVLFQTLQDGQVVFTKSAQFTFLSSTTPTTTVELWTENGTPAKIATLPDNGSTNQLPTNWDVYFQVANTTHTYYRLVLEKLVSGSYTSLRDVNATFSAVASATYESFGTDHSGNYAGTSEALLDGTYRATLYLKNGGTDLPTRTVVFSLSPLAPVVQGSGLRTTNILIQEVNGHLVDVSTGDTVDGEGRRYRMINGEKFIAAYQMSLNGRIPVGTKWVTTRIFCNSNGHAVDLKVKKLPSYIGRTLTFRKIYYSDTLGYDTMAIPWHTVAGTNKVYKSCQHILKIT